MKVLLAAWLLTLSLPTPGAESDLKLVGEARLKVLFWSVYDSRLYTADGTYMPEQRPVKLELEYLRDVKAADLVSKTQEEWQQQGLENPRQGQWLESLAAIWPDINKEDQLSLQIDANNHSRFYYNGELIGVIEDPEFGSSFLNIWLSPNTSRPELRLALIGSH